MFLHFLFQENDNKRMCLVFAFKKCYIPFQISKHKDTQRCDAAGCKLPNEAAGVGMGVRKNKTCYAGKRLRADAVMLRLCAGVDDKDVCLCGRAGVGEGGRCASDKRNLVITSNKLALKFEGVGDLLFILATYLF